MNGEDAGQSIADRRSGKAIIEWHILLRQSAQSHLTWRKSRAAQREESRPKRAGEIRRRREPAQRSLQQARSSYYVKEWRRRMRKESAQSQECEQERTAGNGLWWSASLLVWCSTGKVGFDKFQSKICYGALVLNVRSTSHVLLLRRHREWFPLGSR